MLRSHLKTVILAIIATAIGFAIGRETAPDPNAVPTFGNSGLPKNCRAIIETSIREWEGKVYDAEAAMNGIRRNCGRYGKSW